MSKPLNNLSIALWSSDLYYPVRHLNAWFDVVEQQIQKAQQAGAKLLVLPEYTVEQWLSFAPDQLSPSEEIPWLARQAPNALSGLSALASRYQVAILAGTMPVSLEHVPALTTPPYVNRAHLLLPNGRILHQDKLCLTPFERQPNGWYLSAGAELTIMQWHGFKVAVLVCLDVELPALSARLAEYDVDLLLVPSRTHSEAGYARVFNCARARAIELCCCVAVVGCVGTSPVPRAQMRPNVGGAAVFTPSEIAQGVFYQSPPLTEADDTPGTLTIVEHIPMAWIHTLRHGQAEVWPGAWRGQHIRITEVAEEKN